MKNKLKIFSFLMVLIFLLPSANAYYIGDNKWEDNNSGLEINSSVDSQYHSAILSAANTWTDAGSSFYFHQIPTASGYTSNSTDVMMGLVSDPDYLAEERTVIEETINGQTYKRYSQVVFDYEQEWTTSATIANLTNAFDIETVALHELGHAVGLGHSEYTTALMTEEALPPVKRSLTSDDINGIKALYPSNRNNQEVVNTLRDGIELHINPTIVPMSEEEMTEKATLIVSATVKQNMPARWDTQDGSDPSSRTESMFSTNGYLIFQDTLIEVEEVHKGELPEGDNQIYVRQSGGAVNDVEMINEYTVNYQKDQQVLLYLFEDTGTRSYGLGPEHYFAYPGKGQLFITDENEAVNGIGNNVNTEELLSLLSEVDSE
ncbi:hypothetical protein MsAg5_12710 [Methanosarcinaceae archaeon Ag5]|uniref:Peptidase M10 metallopeptidase domain-containing protein n=1 Tax=Methanolapillus africanus TaxID=3028297 RepID=A0AAE4SE39_9EURY|nr:hypothetical protein [Methanosarcinaceae archaeon Ag5]